MDPLDELFERLRAASGPTEVEALQNGIWQIWLTTDSHLLDKHLEAGMRAMAAGDYGPAIAAFTEIITQAPDYAEGWNKRATTYYLRGEYRASLLDIQETLRREPRHFGALSGWATMLRMLGDEAGALRVLLRLERICRHWPGLQAQLHDLRGRLDR